jgi:acetyltransferase-like isoleucine patch superfamily enzyme
MPRIVILTLTVEHLQKLESISFEVDSNQTRKLKVGNKIVFREDVKIGRNVGIYKGNKIASLGNYSFSRSAFDELVAFDTGNYVSIAENVQSFGFEHPTDFVGTSPIFYQRNRKLFPDNGEENLLVVGADKGVTVGNDVWIGRNVLLKRGVVIGDGAVIGAGSVVTKNIAAFTIAAGNPAKKIRNRFSQEVQARLMQLKWWNYPAEVIQNVKFNQPFDLVLSKLERTIDNSSTPVLEKILLLDYLN